MTSNSVNSHFILELMKLGAHVRVDTIIKIHITAKITEGIMTLVSQIRWDVLLRVSVSQRIFECREYSLNTHVAP